MKAKRRSRSKAVSLNSKRQSMPCLDVLEARTLLSSTFWVTSTSDGGDGSLRQAILDANSNPGYDTIAFAVDSQFPTIQLANALPSITDPVSLDGTTQDGYAGVPIVWLDGGGLSFGDNGLVIATDNSLVRGLGVTGFSNYGSAAGILVEGDGNAIRGNYIGLTAYGEGQCNDYGIILAGQGNLVGGTNAADANVISDNYMSGVLVEGAGNRIEGNLIGLDPTGTWMAGNWMCGVEVGSTGDVPASAWIENNVICGNWDDGVGFGNNFGGSDVVNNRIGVDASGTLAMGNQGSGVSIGTHADGAGGVNVRDNVISGNYGDGVRMANASDNVVSGNRIGVDASGLSTTDSTDSTLGNYGNGVMIFGSSSDNRVGGDDWADRNVIGGNSGDGIMVMGFGPGTGNLVQGNFVGVGADGATAIPNQADGVDILGSGNSVSGNVISGNAGWGLSIMGDSNTVQGNFVGTQADGTSPLGNGGDGIDIYNGNQNQIGGVAQGEGNVVAFNGGSGVGVLGGSGNAIRGNSIFANVSIDPFYAAIGIDLGGDGVTTNDSFGHDGPNAYQNFPELVSATRAGSSMTVQGRLSADADRTYMVDIYASEQADPTGYGQGQTYLGSAMVTTNGNGVATFTATVQAGPAGQMIITATATDLAGNTSEFGSAIEATGSVGSTLAASTTTMSSSANPSAFGQLVTLTAQVTAETPNTLTGSVTFYEGENVLGTADLVDGTATMTTATLSVGEHEIIAVYGGDENAEPSASEPLTQTVQQAILLVTAGDASKVYGDANPVFTVNYDGFVLGQDASELGGVLGFDTPATDASHVGMYTISLSGLTSSDYAITYVDGSLSVTQASLTITADNQTKVYGAAMPAFTVSYNGLVNGDSAASLATQPTLSTTATDASHVGSYAITASGAVDADYAITYADGSLSITQASLTITADNQTKVYGAALPALTVSYSGLVNGDTAASLATQPTLSTTATAASHVGSYPITVSGAVDADYAIAYVNGSLSVTQASLTITANNQTKVYGAVLPSFTASYSGLVNGDTAASLTTQPTVSTTATAASHVGSYPITASGAVDADYAIAYVDGSLSVTQASMTITADNQTKVYGAVLPSFTASYSGLVNGDTAASLATQPTLSTTATAASHVGSYSITASGAVDADYAITYVNGSLSVTQASLTITANNQTKVYGAALPSLTVSYSGLVNGDTAASLTTQPTLSTTATTASHVGSYPITATGAVDADYAIAYVNGSLSVMQAASATTVSSSANPSTLGQSVMLTASVTAGGSLTGTVTFRDGGTVIGSATLSGGTASMATSALSAGSHTITAVYSGDENSAASTSAPLAQVVTANATLISGRTLRDMTGNGMSDDDIVLPGTTVRLYIERNGNGDLDSGDGAAVATVVSDANGTYTFANMPAGQYYVKETVPTDYIRTIPYFSDYYEVNLVGSTGGTSFDFDNYKKCTGTITNVSFKIDNCKTVTDLRGQTQQGDTVTVTFTVAGTTSAYVTFVTYDAPTAAFDANNAADQTIYQQAGGTFAPGVHTLTVSIPLNYYQIDFVRCHAIDRLGPAGSNIFYSAQSRLISADNGGMHSDTDDMAAATSFWAGMGQTLIRRFDVTDSTPSPTRLGNWLAQSFPSIYGSGANNLAGKSNAYIATLFTQLNNNSAKKTDAQVLATALNVYASTTALGGDTASDFGFEVTDEGLGGALFNVQTSGSAFGVANNSTMSVWQLLQATNAKSKADVLYNGASSLLTLAFNTYSSINKSGGIA